MYNATKLLLTYAYTEEERLNHAVSGKRANRKVTDVKQNLHLRGLQK